MTKILAFDRTGKTAIPPFDDDEHFKSWLDQDNTDSDPYEFGLVSGHGFQYIAGVHPGMTKTQVYRAILYVLAENEIYRRELN